jgi:DNA gyrase inhibitor GyrI
MLSGEPGSAICVQRFDDSLSSAIHTTYRSWLRSSSMHEPRDPPLEVVSDFSFPTIDFEKSQQFQLMNFKFEKIKH